MSNLGFVNPETITTYQKFSRYWKSFIASVGAVVLIVDNATADGIITNAEIESGIIAGVTALFVFLKKNGTA